MPDQTAAERAAEVLRYAHPWGRPVVADLLTPADAIAALMAHPDLLVDLAIEAGALVQARNYKYPQEGAYVCGTFAGWYDDEADLYGWAADGHYTPLYRRREASDDA